MNAQLSFKIENPLRLWMNPTFFTITGTGKTGQTKTMDCTLILTRILILCLRGKDCYRQYRAWKFKCVCWSNTQITNGSRLPPCVQ